MMEFLYFPDDKTEYIPAIIQLVIFMALAGVTMYFFYKHSKKEEREFNQQYQQQKDEETETHTDDQL